MPLVRAPLRPLRALLVAALLCACGGPEDTAVAAAGPPSGRDVPVFEDGVVRFSDRFAERVGYRTEDAAPQPIIPVLHVTGVLEFDERRLAAVGSRISGRVSEVHVVDGAEVEAGEVLASLESAELGEAQAEIYAIRARAQAATANESRKKQLAREGIASPTSSSTSAPRPSGRPRRTSTASPRLARYGVAMEDALAAIEAARVGTPLGWVFEDQRRFGVRLLVPPKTTAPESLGDLYVENMDGERIHLSELARIAESEGPPQVRRKKRSRTIRVEVNLRGRDLVSWVREAQAKVDAAVALPTGYKLEWGGQFEDFQRAAARLGMVVPVALLVIFVMLLWNFGDLRYAVAVFAIVPFALIGGIGGLLLRDLSFSIPAAVGFIALAGIAVLNGVVLATEVRGFIAPDRRFDDALLHGSVHTMRAVLTTGAVAALGFLPMALSTGAGPQSRRPLATVVVFGIGASTLMTMFLLPALLKILLRREQRAAPMHPSER